MICTENAEDPEYSCQTHCLSILLFRGSMPLVKLEQSGLSLLGRERDSSDESRAEDRFLTGDGGANAAAE